MNKNRSTGISLRNFHRSETAHTLFALFLLFKQFFLSCNITAVALREDVLAQGFYCFPRDYLPADAGLNRHFKKLARDMLFQLFSHFAGAGIRAVRVDDKRQRVYHLAV